jgi:hypothetical protein
MSLRGLVRAFVTQWWTAGILLRFWSVQTAQRAVQVYAAVVSFVAVHGPVPMSWLRWPA